MDAERDIRVVPAVTGTDVQRAEQRAYLARYNSAIAFLSHGAGHGKSFVRPKPVSRPAFAFFLLLILMPLLFNLYFRYRLGPYRLDGRNWTVSFGDLSYRYMWRSTYAEESWPLLLALWISVGLILPWALLIVGVLGRRPVQ